VTKPRPVEFKWLFRVRSCLLLRIVTNLRKTARYEGKIPRSRSDVLDNLSKVCAVCAATVRSSASAAAPSNAESISLVYALFTLFASLIQESTP
jgi:hypothetical protein